MLALLSGCASPKPEPVPDDGELKIGYVELIGFPVTAPGAKPGEGFTHLWLLSNEGRYWIRTRDGVMDGCGRYLDGPTSERIIKVWRHAAPLLEKIRRETDPETSLIADGTSYYFEGYGPADIRGKMPAYDLRDVQAMIVGMWDYCRNISLTAQRALEVPLSALERQAK
jgi:hypothetical protein